jgi:hypothetical protein
MINMHPVRLSAHALSGLPKVLLVIPGSGLSLNPMQIAALACSGDQGDGFAGLRDADLDVRGELWGGPAKVPGSRSLLVMPSHRADRW